MSEISWIALVGTATLLGLLVVTAVLRVIAEDGYGHRPAPRGTDDWNAGQLPSRPYGH